MVISDAALSLLIASMGAIVGGLFTYLSSMATSRIKVRELEISYTQKIRDNYLKNARELMEQVYIPLIVKVSNLKSDYNTFRSTIEDIRILKENEFKDKITEFVDFISSLKERGGDAYLTNELDENIEMFVVFLKNSVNASENRFVVWHVLDIGFGQPVTINHNSSFPLVSNNLYGVYKSKSELIAANINSKTFEQKFIEYVSTIKFLIKEVTLGTYNK